SRSLGKLNA
ncbi:his Kinase A domain protein, partial [Vibrio parahaemolyticus VPTS-2010_2]